jgi:hypothetical protein
MDNQETLAALGTQDTVRRKPKRQLRMDNPETLATLGTQKINKTPKHQTKKMRNTDSVRGDRS